MCVCVYVCVLRGACVLRVACVAAEPPKLSVEEVLAAVEVAAARGSGCGDRVRRGAPRGAWRGVPPATLVRGATLVPWRRRAGVPRPWRGRCDPRPIRWLHSRP